MQTLVVLDSFILWENIFLDKTIFFIYKPMFPPFQIALLFFFVLSFTLLWTECVNFIFVKGK